MGPYISIKYNSLILIKSTSLSNKPIVSNEFFWKTGWVLPAEFYLFISVIPSLFPPFLCGSVLLQVSLLAFAKSGTLSCSWESGLGNVTSNTSISEIRSCLQSESKQTAGILAQGIVAHGLHTNYFFFFSFFFFFLSFFTPCGSINFSLYEGTLNISQLTKYASMSLWRFMKMFL